jgi:hypothetical protein
MRKLALLIAVSPALALAQVQASASFSLDLPLVLPQLVVVQPGIQVVPNVDVEVFHADGYYWTRRDNGWYRSSSPRSGWVYAPRGVPVGLTRLPPGHYRRWRGPPPPPARPAPAYRQEVRRAERRDERREERHEGRHDDRGRGHDRDDDRGHGHGRRD